MTTPDYAAVAKKLQEIRAKQLQATKLLDLAEHQIMIGQIWPEAFEGGQKCAAILIASYKHPRITFKREDGERRTFDLEIVAARGIHNRQMIFKDPNGIISREFIDHVQKSNLGPDDRHWVDYNRAREEDTIRMRELRKGYYGNESRIEEGA